MLCSEKYVVVANINEYCIWELCGKQFYFLTQDFSNGFQQYLDINDVSVQEVSLFLCATK